MSLPALAPIICRSILWPIPCCTLKKLNFCLVKIVTRQTEIILVVTSLVRLSELVQDEIMRILYYSISDATLVAKRWTDILSNNDSQG